MIGSDLRFESLHPLIGRDRELAGIRERLTESRLVTLTGPGGVGKTRLAVAVASDRHASIVDLSAIREVSQVASEIAAAVGADPDSGRPPAERIATVLGHSDPLLVLDNLEQLIGVSEVLGELLVAAPELRILGTSRSPTHLAGEVLVPIAPLALPIGDSPEDVKGSPAAELFLAVARAHGRDEPLDDESARAVADIVRRVDGLPLALELAGARAPLFSPAAIARHVAAGQRGFLRDPSSDRHGSLDAVLDWSLDLLDQRVRQAFLDLSALPASFDLGLATAVANLEDPITALDTLVQHGLLLVRPGVDGEPRFAMLETIRAAARTRQDTHAAAAAYMRLGRAVAELVERFGMKGLLPLTSDVARLAPHATNIRAALEWATTNDVELGLSIATRATDLWHARGNDREGLEWLERLLAMGTASPAATARGKAVFAAALWQEGRIEEAIATALEVTSTALEDDATAARAHHVLALIGAERGDVDASERHRALLEIVADRSQDRSQALWLLGATATIATLNGDTPRAIEAYDALALAAASQGFPAMEALARTNSIDMLLIVGRPRDAHRQAVRAIELYESAGPWVGIGWPLAELARASARLGDQQSARAALITAVADARVFYNDVVVGSVLEAALAYFVAFGDAEAGCRAFGAALSIGHASGPRWSALLLRSADPDLIRARKAIGSVKVDVALQAGREDDVEAALAHAMLGLDEGVASGPMRATASVRLPHGDLTHREVEVLRLLAVGRSDSEIAEALFISPKTASVHVSTIKGKLGVASRVEAALRARELFLQNDG